MGTPVRPDSRLDTTPRHPALPFHLPRVLSPEEFDQAQYISAEDVVRWNIPLAPPTALFNEQEQQQVKEGVKSVGHALADPIGTAKHIGKSIIDDLTKVFLAPTEGARNDPDAKTGLLPFPHLPPGAIVSKENTPDAQTREEMHRAAINTSINAAFAALPQLAAPARIAANTALGAYYDPDQPLRGATAGALFGETLHAALKVAPKVAEVLKDRPVGLSTQDVGPNASRQAAGESYTAPLDAGKDPRLVNIEKLGLSPESEAQFRSMVPAQGEKVRVTHAETEALARELEMDPARLQSRIGDWSGGEALAARNVISQNTGRIVELSKITADGTKPVAERQAAQEQVARLTSDVSVLSNRLAGERTKAGRDLNAYKIIAKNTMDPATWIALAARARGPVGLTAEQQARVLQLVGQNDRGELISYVSALHKSTPLEKAVTAWKAGLLTGTGTHLVNLAGGAATVALENIKDLPATGIDLVASLVTGERTKAPSFRGNVVAASKGLALGARAAAKVLRQGDTESLGKWDFRRTNYKSPVLDWYVNGVFNLLSAEDKVWRGAAFGRALEEELRVRARALAKMDVAPGGRQASEQTILADLRQNVPSDVLVKAAAEADYALLQAPNAAHKFITAGKRALPAAGQAAVDVVVPFVKTPTNAALVYGVDYSPLGFAKTLAGQLKEPSQRKLADGLGRAVTGSTFLVLGAMLVREGLMTGNTVTAAEQAEGKRPHSVLIDGRWYDVARIPGPGTLLAMGAQAYSDAAKGTTKTDKASAALFANVRVIADQPMVSGLSGLVDAVRDRSPAKDRAGGYLARQAASVIPSAVNQLAGALDKTQRDPKGFGETIKSRIPGLREQVPARQDLFGREAPNDITGGRAYIDFLRSSVARPDALLDEMARLDVGLSLPAKTMRVGSGNRAVEHERTAEARRALQQQIGSEVEERLRRVLTSTSYAELSDEEKKARLERVISDVRTKVYAQERRTLRKEQLAAKTAKP